MAAQKQSQMKSYKEGHYGYGVVLALCDRYGNRMVKGMLHAVLYRAASNGDVEVVRALLDAGAAVDTKDQHERTALHLAALGGHNEVVTVLLDAGAAVDSKDYDQFTALHYAARKGHAEVVAGLLDHGADPAAKAFCGNTPLIEASAYSHSNIVELLLGQGALENEKNRLLLLAEKINTERVARFLMSRVQRRRDYSY